MIDEDNLVHAHEHTYNAWCDFCLLRERVRSRSGYDSELLHSISHHLRHAVWRTSKAVPAKKRRYARRHAA